MSRSRRRTRLADAAVVEVDDRAELRARLDAELSNVELLRESFADLASQLNDPGWVLLTAQFQQEFAPENLRQIRALCRLFAVKNSLVKRGLGLRCAYVWAQGVEITARANGKRRREQDVQGVVARFLDDPANQRAFTGPAARERLERCLGTDGEFFPILFTRPSTGEVQVRVVGADEITEIVCNPEDRSEPWYYRRVWTQQVLGADGYTTTETREQLHPALDYRPRVQPKSFGRVSVAWDAPMMHVKVGDLEGWQRGIPDAYAAIDWARAYKEFLEDWARLVKSLSRFAWRLTVKGSNRAQAKTRLAAAPARDQATGVAQAVGGTAVTPPDGTFEPIPKTGATVDSESGKPLAAMVAAALDVPLTMLLADPGQTGARAVAETLDQPTELGMGQRREMWAGVYRRILTQVIVEAVRAPDGPLKGGVSVDAWGRESVRLNGNTDTTIDLTWPDLDSDPAAVVKSVVEASSTGVLPPDQVARLLLTALGVRHVDELVEAMTDDDGRFRWPAGPSLGGSGGEAAALAAGGGDPAEAGAGSMTPDDAEPPPDSVAEGWEPQVPNVLIDLAEARSDRKLRAYWTRGAGAAKIGWGTPNDFDRCVRHLRKYVRDPEGLCNEYHQAALGAPPGKGH